MDKSVIIPYVADLSWPWCIEYKSGRYLYWMLNRFAAAGNDLNAIYPDAKIDEDDNDIEDKYLRQIRRKRLSWYNNDVAVVEVDGTLMKHPPPSLYAGRAALTYGQLTAILTDLVENSNASKVILNISSFGGSSAGAIPCMDNIAKLAKQKPIIAFISDYACSGGYFLASQCSEVVAAHGSHIGSIGVLMVLTDDTKQLEAMGLKLTVVSTAEYKGLGGDGEISDKLVKDQLRICQDLHNQLTGRVKTARNLTDDQLEAVTTGQVWQPPQAKRLNLIDKILNFDDLVDIKTRSDKYHQSANPQPIGDNPTMSDEMKTQIDALTKRVDDAEAKLSENEEQIAQVQVERDAAVTERDNVIKERDAAVAEKDKIEKEHAALVQEDEQRQLEYRQKACTSWVVKQCDNGTLAPAAAPKLNALLCALTPVTEDIEISYVDNDGNQQLEKGQLYEIAQEAIEGALINSNPEATMQFEEKAHSRISETEQAELDAETNHYEKRLAEKGVKLNSDQPLAQIVENKTTQNRTGIKSLLHQVEQA